MRRMGWGLAGLALCAGTALAGEATPDRAPRASVMVATDRFGDVLWENDLVAHRIYSRALEPSQPPSSSGIDAWGKRAAWPFMDRTLLAGTHHEDNGEGVDFYNVGTSRGAGGIGVWFDNKLWTSRNYARVRILDPGPAVARFEVDYAPWPVDTARRVWETRRFTLAQGSYFTRMTSVLHSDRKGPLVIAIGIAKRAVADQPGEFLADRARGSFTGWSAGDPHHGHMAVALRIDPTAIVEVKESEADNWLVLVRVTPGKPFTWHIAASWDGAGRFASHRQWADFVAAQQLDFAP